MYSKITLNAKKQIIQEQKDMVPKQLLILASNHSSVSQSFSNCGIFLKFFKNRGTFRPFLLNFVPKSGNV